MAEFIDPNEIMHTSFEPKLSNRFVMYIDGIPTFLIKQTNRPSPESDEVTINHINTEFYVKGKSRWGDISISIYDAITPSSAQIAMEWFRQGHESVTGRDGYRDMYTKDVTINVIGPLGDIVEQWTLKSAWPKSIDFGELNWDGSDPLEIGITLRYDFAILQF